MTEEFTALHPEGLSELQEALALALLHANSIKFGNFTLKSGLQSPIYIDLRNLISHPKALEAAAHALIDQIKLLTFDRITGLPYAAIPIATAVGLFGGYPGILLRKEIKAYGTGKQIEGEFNPGEVVAVLDDLITTGGTKFEAIHELQDNGLLVHDIAVVVDRQQGGKEQIEEAGYTLHSALQLIPVLDFYKRLDLISADHYDASMTMLRPNG